MAGHVLLGADGVMAALEKIAKGMGGGEVDVGFLEGATYPDGTPVAAVAFWNEFGGEFMMPAHDVSVYRSLNADGDFNQQGRFVKKTNSNFETRHHVKAYKISRPPRPFFRSMIAGNSGKWPEIMAKLVAKSNYDGKYVLQSMGQLIKGQLEKSINDLMSPPLAKSTVKNKGFAKPLIDTSHMINSIDFEVK